MSPKRAPEPDETATGTAPDDAADARADSVRQCAVTRERLPKAAMIRFVAGPEGVVVPDLKARLPGRGVWIAASRGQVETAIGKRVFARAFRSDIKADAGLAAQIDALLAKDALQAFALAIKAGEVVFGFAKVEETLKRKSVPALVHAADGAADGKRKLDAAFLKATGTRPIIVATFTAAELGLASGRTNVIHAALIEGGASARFLQRARRLTRYRGGIDDPANVSISNTED